MQAPPYVEPPKQRNSTTVILIVIGVIAVGGCLVIAIGAALLFPVFSQARAAAKETESLSNVKKINVALQVYASDYDDHLPPAEVWRDALTTSGVVYDEIVYEDPLLGRGGPQRPSYAMNWQAGGVKVTKLKAPDRFVVIYGSNILAMNPAGGPEDVRLTPRKRMIVGFADGSAKLVKGEEAGSLVWMPK